MMCGGGEQLKKNLMSVPLLATDPFGGELKGSAGDLKEGIYDSFSRSWDKAQEGDYLGAHNESMRTASGLDLGTTMEEGAQTRRAREADAAAAAATPADTSDVDSYAMANTGLGVGADKKRTRKHGMRQNILTSGQGLN